MVLLSYFLMTVLMLLGIFLIGLILLQRGRGGGLAGAFGGMGGQSAFGTKAGDVFTRITIGVAAAWILLCAGSVVALHNSVGGRTAPGIFKSEDAAGELEKAAPKAEGDADEWEDSAAPAPAGNEQPAGEVQTGDAKKEDPKQADSKIGDAKPDDGVKKEDTAPKPDEKKPEDTQNPQEETSPAAEKQEAPKPNGDDGTDKNEAVPKEAAPEDKKSE